VPNRCKRDIPAVAGRGRNTGRAKILVCAVLFAGCATAAESGPSEKVSITQKSFRCITEMTHVRYFYVANLAGNLRGTVQIAESAKPGIYPVGSVLQLVPTEVMVKREKGFNPDTHDWEFFELEVSQAGSKIRRRGFAEVNNRFGGNCFVCHVKARPDWDFVCDIGHGCDPIPITRAMSGALQRTDPRCRNQPPISREDATALAQLGQIVRALNATGTAKQ
jgi:hypothetical protein